MVFSRPLFFQENFSRTREVGFSSSDPVFTTSGLRCPRSSLDRLLSIFVPKGFNFWLNFCNWFYFFCSKTSSMASSAIDSFQRWFNHSWLIFLWDRLWDWNRMEWQPRQRLSWNPSSFYLLNFLCNNWFRMCLRMHCTASFFCTNTQVSMEKEDFNFWH